MTREGHDPDAGHFGALAEAARDLDPGTAELDRRPLQFNSALGNARNVQQIFDTSRLPRQ